MSIVVDFPGGNVYHYKRLRTYEKCTGIQLYNCEYSLDIWAAALKSGGSFSILSKKRRAPGVFYLLESV